MIFSLLIPLALAANPERHVRVILDVSGSMKDEDPNRLAAISTLLLYDLVRPDAANGDSFEVIPFDPAVGWDWNGNTPPNHAGAPIVWDGSREPFSTALQQIPYNGWHTLYFPGIQDAVEDLLNLPTTTHRRQQLLVLITDGLPEHQQAEEISQFRARLADKIRDNNINFYVLAFGGAYDASFFDQMLRSPTEGMSPIGIAMQDENGEHLMERMITIFEQTFGYSATNLLSNSEGLFPLTLDNGENPDKVAIVGWHSQKIPPHLSIDNGNIDMDTTGSHQDGGAAYHLLWLLRPGTSTFQIRSSAQELTILRPRNWTIRDLSGIRMVVAEHRVTMSFEVAPQSGMGGMQNIKFQFIRHEATVPARPAGPIDNQGRQTSTGQQFEIQTSFSDRNRQIYEGNIEVQAYPDNTSHNPIASMILPIQVYPELGLQPVDENNNPFLVLGDSQTGLQEGNRVCGKVHLRGSAPDLGVPTIPLRIWLGKPLNEHARDAIPFLQNSTITVSGLTLRYESERAPGRAAQPNADETWFQGRPIAVPQLGEAVEVCVQIGEAPEGGTIKIPLMFRLDRPPYNSAVLGEEMIPPLELQLTLRQTSMVTRLGDLCTISVLAALALLFAWYGRFRPDLPPDFQITIDSGRQRIQQKVTTPLNWRSLLGLVPEYPVSTPTTDRILGYVRPIQKDLFLFQPVADVTLGNPASSSVQADGSYLLTSGAVYPVHAPGLQLNLQLDYLR